MRLQRLRHAALLVILAACASTSNKNIVRRTEALRTDVLFGYYGDCETCVAEVKDHASMMWIAGWESSAGHIPTIIERARLAQPTRTVIMLPGMYKDKRAYEPAFDAAKAIFDGMRANGSLRTVAAIYPQDEPELLGLSDTVVTQTNERLRKLMREYFELADTPLAVIYSDRKSYPGLAAYDWVGIDSYRQGAAILGKSYDALVKRLRSDQRLLLVPGGASPWKQSPKPFVSYANSHPQVVGIVAFLWADNANPKLGPGIRSNGMAAEYKSIATAQ